VAVIRTGGIITDIRGKVADVIYSRNQGGAYVKGLGPAAPAPTSNQTACRNTLTALAQYWADTMTVARRAAWRRYAQVWPTENRWGELSIRSGYCAFIRINQYYHRRYGSIIYLDPPPDCRLSVPVVTYTVKASDQYARISLPPSGYTDLTNGMYFHLFCGKPASAGVAWYNGPWLYKGQYWHSGSWSPATWFETWPWTVTTGQLVGIRLLAQEYASGRLSGIFRLNVNVIA